MEPRMSSDTMNDNDVMINQNHDNADVLNQQPDQLSDQQTDLHSIEAQIEDPQQQPAAQQPEAEDEIKLCRICHGDSEDETLISPCRCAGSIELVHETCLLLWLTNKNRSKCELCGYQFQFETKFSDDAPSHPSILDSIVVLFRTCISYIPIILHTCLAIIIWSFVVPLLSYYGYTMIVSLILRFKFPPLGHSATLTLFKYWKSPSSLFSLHALISLWFESHVGILLGLTVIIVLFGISSLKNEIDTVLKNQALKLFQEYVNQVNQRLHDDLVNLEVMRDDNDEEFLHDEDILHEDLLRVNDILNGELLQDENMDEDDALLDDFELDNQHFHDVRRPPIVNPVPLDVPVNNNNVQPAQQPLDPLVRLLARPNLNVAPEVVDRDEADRVLNAELDNAEPFHRWFGINAPVSTLLINSVRAILTCIWFITLLLLLTTGVGRITILMLQFPLLLWGWLMGSSLVDVSGASSHTFETIMHVISSPLIRCTDEYYLDVIVLCAMGIVGCIVMVMCLSQMKTLGSQLLYACAYSLIVCKVVMLLVLKMIISPLSLAFTTLSIALTLILNKSQFVVANTLLEILMKQPLATLPAFWFVGLLVSMAVFKLATGLQSIFRHEVLASSIGIFLRFLKLKDPHSVQVLQQMITFPIFLQVRTTILNYMFISLCTLLFIGLPIQMIYRFTNVLPMQFKSTSAAVFAAHNLDFLLIQFTIPFLLERFHISGMISDGARAVLKSIVKLCKMDGFLLKLPEVPADQIPVLSTPSHSIKHFHARVFGVCFSIWLASVLTVSFVVIVPLVLARAILFYIGISLTFHDLYCWLLGVNLVAGMIVGTFKLVQFMNHYDMQVFISAVKRWSMIISKLIIAMFPLGIVMPMLLGTAVDLIIMNPLLPFSTSYSQAVSWFTHPLSHPSIYWVWSSGIICQKVAVQLVRLGAHERFDRALDRLHRDGWVNLNLRHLALEIVWPVTKELFNLIGIPACLYAIFVCRGIFMTQDYDVVMWRTVQYLLVMFDQHRPARLPRYNVSATVDPSFRLFMATQLNVTTPLLGPITYEEHRSHLVPTMLPSEALNFFFFRFIFLAVFVLRVCAWLSRHIVDWLSQCQRTSFEQRYAVGRRIANPLRPNHDVAHQEVEPLVH